MADRSFGVKDIDLIGASGTPTIESPNNLNINAVNVAISTDITVAGKVSLGTGTSISSPATNVLTFGTNSVERVRILANGNVGIGTTVADQALHVVGEIVATDDITAFHVSDRRLKKDIDPIDNAVEKVKQINGVKYSWNDEYLKDKKIDNFFVKEREVGVIAQEIEEILPEIVVNRDNGYKAVRYERLVALLIEAIKEQQKQIDELREKLEG